LIGTFSTGTRITCLEAFEMTGKAQDGEEELVVEKPVESSSDDSE
jgi:protein MAK11